MSLIQSKQINKLLGTLRRAPSAFTLAATSSAVVTAAFAGKTSGGSDTVAGVFTSAPQNRVAVIDKVTGNAITDGSGNTVYGRLTFAATVWTLSFFTVVASTETAYTVLVANPAVGNLIDLVYGESVQFKDIVATDVINGLDSIDESDIDANSHKHVTDVFVPTAAQTAFTLTQTPKAAAGAVQMFVNGVRVTTFSNVAAAVTYVNTDFALEITDAVEFVYPV